MKTVHLLFASGVLVCTPKYSTIANSFMTRLKNILDNTMAGNHRASECLRLNYFFNKFICLNLIT